MLLESVFGSVSAERVLLYLHNYEDGYALGVASTYDMPVSVIQKQLAKFELGGVLVSRLVGRTRLYTWNPRFPLRTALRQLLGEELKYLDDETILKYYRERRRPRRPGKAL